jgi:hypothetical protein
VSGQDHGVPDRLVPIVVAVLAATTVVLAIEPWPVGVFQDDGIYVVLARALANGEGYRFVQLPGAPAATHYPPGYPLFLAALWKLAPSFPGNVVLFKFANALLVGLAAALTWWWARRYAQLGPLGAGASALLFTACAPVVLLSVMVLSEPLFMAGVVAALMAGERAARSGSIRDAIVAGVAGASLAMVRTLGVLVVPATVGALLLRRQWRPAFVVGVVATIGLLPWQLWVGAHADEVPAVFNGKYGSYFGWLGGALRDGGLPWLLEVMRHNAGQLAFESWTHTGTVLGPTWLRVGATLTVAVVLGVGYVVSWSRLRVVALFVTAYLAIVLAWPFAPARFLWGIWPVLGILCVLGIRGLAGSRAQDVPPARRFAASAIATALLLGYGKFNVEATRERWWSQVQGSVAERARPLADWVTANTDSSAVVATDDDLLVHLYTGRRTVPNWKFTPQEHLVPQTPDFAADALRDILGTYEVDYVLSVSDIGLHAANGLLRGARPALRLVTPLRRGAVFEVLPVSAHTP